MTLIENFSNVKAIIIGVLEMEKTSSLQKMSKTDRKDLVFYNQLTKIGAEVNMFLDSQAKLDDIYCKIDEIINSSNKDTTFLFYFAGHGYRRYYEYFFCNWDFNINLPGKSGFRIDYLAQKLSKFNGCRLVLIADCCYSGALIDVGHQLVVKKPSLEIAVMASAYKHSISTINWTFTEAIIDNIDKPIGDLIANTKENMKNKEKQFCDFFIHKIKINRVKLARSPLPNYSRFISKKVEVLWNERYFPAIMLEADDDFYHIAYDSGGHEWVMYNRIRTGEEKKVKIKCCTKYYHGYILETIGDKSFITYKNYDHTWDEWVGKNMLL